MISAIERDNLGALIIFQEHLVRELDGVRKARLLFFNLRTYHSDRNLNAATRSLLSFCGIAVCTRCPVHVCCVCQRSKYIFMRVFEREMI